MNETRPPQGAQAALRAVRLLKLFTIEQPDMSLSEISQAAGLNKTTTHRLLRALQSESLIARNSVTSAYCLGPGLMALGVQALASSDLRRRIRPLLKTLAHESGETATLEVQVENSMMVLDEVAGSHVIAASGHVGTRWPMHATSTGKVWLAFDEGSMERIGDHLPAVAPKTLTTKESLRPQIIEIRARGYAETVDELEDGFAAVATVIRGLLGDVLGSVSICGPTQRLNAARRKEYAALLCRSTAMLEGNSNYRQ
jgi:DNA-binding IclR family transcriptional regulator